MAGLMMKYAHAKNATQGTAQQSGKKQRSFRNTPGAPSGPPFVNPHQDKRAEINCQQIPPQQLPQLIWHIAVPFRFFGTVYSGSEKKARKTGEDKTFMEIS